ncbi:hypothetical protein C8J56DRAFT_982688 [Mycena floridula]|nr:hypothetical protein C8J56DRAFT_982688 [Mycena floridula]
MQFIALALLASMASAAIVPSTLQVREDISVECLEAEKSIGGYNLNTATFSSACAGLANACLTAAKTTSDLWGSNVCVAAAGCSGAGAIHFLANCTTTDTPFTLAAVPSLDYNIYASIVGECAWEEGGCPMTSQNFVDFIYGSLTAINSEFWPNSAADVISDWFNPILSWTAEAETIPYLNFNDWLHFSSSL